MEDGAFGRCYVACMNRCVDDCRRDPAICPGAPGDAPRSATSSASPSAGPPTSTWSLLIWSRPGTNNPLFSPQPPRVVRRSAASFRRAGEGAKEPRCRREAQVESTRRGGRRRRAQAESISCQNQRRSKGVFRARQTRCAQICGTPWCLAQDPGSGNPPRNPGRGMARS